MEIGGGKGNAHGRKLTYTQPDGGHIERKSGVGRKGVVPEQKNRSHPGKLLDQLCGGGNGCPVNSVKVPVDAAVDAGRHEGKGYNAQQGSTAGLVQKTGSDPFGVLVDKERAQGGKDCGEKQTGSQNAKRGPVVIFFHVPCNKAGNCVMYAGGGNGKDDAGHRPCQLVNAHTFLAEGAGHENTVKKTDEAAGQAGCTQKKCAGDQGVLFYGKLHGNLRKHFS